MDAKTENLIDSIIKKLKNNNSRSIYIEKQNFIDFVNFLKKDN